MDNHSPDFFSKDYFFDRKNSNYFNYNYWNNNRYWKSIIQQVKKNNINGKALDIGCAFGFLLKRLEPYFQELHGIDISAFALEKAKKETPSTQYHQINLNTQNLPYPDEYFNLITALDVLEHTQSIEVSLQKILKTLKKDGYLIISIPLKDTWAGKIFRHFDKDKSHISIPTKQELFNLLKKSNLKIINKTFFYNAGFLKIKGVPTEIEITLQKQ